MNLGRVDDEITADNFNKYNNGNWDVIILDSCTSTFDVAREKIKSNVTNATMIISDMQTGGRGRQQRQWISPSGGLWMSLILKPQLEVSKLSSLTLLCAVAVSKSMEEMFPEITPGIKWPNDIYIYDKKICGILTETILKNKVAEYVIVGVGINANNTTEDFDDEVRKTSISFKKIGLHVNRAKMASLINNKLIDLVKQYEQSKDLDFIMDYYSSHMLWLGKEAAMKNTITGEIAQQGTIKGIDKKGHLLMEIEGRIEKIVSGELSLRRIL